MPGSSVDWAAAMVGEGDKCQLSVSAPPTKALAQSAEFDGRLCVNISGTC